MRPALSFVCALLRVALANEIQSSLFSSSLDQTEPPPPQQHSNVKNDITVSDRPSSISAAVSEPFTVLVKERTTTTIQKATESETRANDLTEQPPDHNLVTRLPFPGSYPDEAICLTPKGREGVCIDLKLCPYLLDMLLTNRTEERDKYLRKSLCNKPEGPNVYVCCDRPTCVTDSGLAGSCVLATVCGPRQSRATRGSCQSSEHVCCIRQTYDGYVSRQTGLPEFGFCGNPEVIVNSSDQRFSHRSQFPWTALLVYRDGNKETQQCGGALIAPRFVLTAAHCADDNLVKVRLGVHNLTESCSDVRSGCPLTVKVVKKVVFPTYNASTQLDDLALLILGSPAPYTSHIRPLCLPEKRLMVKISAHPKFMTAGWGISKDVDLERPHFDMTQTWAELPLRTSTVCEGAMKVWAKMLAPYLTLDTSLPPNTVCAGGTFAGELCSQDSGGVLLWAPNDRNPRTVIGVHSRSVAGCKAPVPAVYTSVQPFTWWINAEMAKYYKIKPPN